MPPPIEVEAVTSGYDRVPAIRDVSLQVGTGEIVAVLGPNGAGKTTLLRTIAGLLPTMQGSVRFLGQPVRHGQTHDAARQGLAYIADSGALFLGLTARENIRLSVPRGQHEAAEAEIVERFPQLESRLGIRAGLLSGGEQQMLAIGRTLVRRPRAVLIDELSLGLAPTIVQELLPVVRQMAKDAQCATLLVEQHVPLALAIADRAYVMARGAISDQLQRAEFDQLERLQRTYMGDEAPES